MKIDFNLKFTLIVIAALIASLATFPYGYKFSFLLNLPNGLSYIIVGCLLGGISSLANAILGVYSLSSIKITKKTHTYIIAAISTLGAIPTGFFSYFGYLPILPNTLNIVTSIVVLMVNSAINFTAVLNLSYSVKKFLHERHSVNKINWARTLVCVMGAVIGAIVSLTAYLATTNGIAHMALNVVSSPNTALHIGSILAFIAWLPLGALYLNAMGFVTAKIYDFAAALRANIKKVDFYKILLVIFVLLSGTAFSRMAYDFYAPQNMLPSFFKSNFIQFLAYHYVMPLALISAAAVNYFALINMIKPEKDTQFLDVIP